MESQKYENGLTLKNQDETSMMLDPKMDNAMGIKTCSYLPGLKPKI
jgi:hypothetical protein